MKPGEFITSDTHFFHKNIIKHSSRPFNDVDEMNEKMILSWNSKVPPDSIVYHLGDFAFAKPSKIIQILRRLNGTIRLVKGNHDHLREDVKKEFDWVRDYYESKMEDGRKIIMCHFPFLTWNGAHKGNWHFHGHCHGNLTVSGTTRMDVGVDTTTDYAPYSYEEIVNLMSNKTYKPVDHHRNEKDDEGPIKSSVFKSKEEYKLYVDDQIKSMLGITYEEAVKLLEQGKYDGTLAETRIKLLGSML